MQITSSSREAFFFLLPEEYGAEIWLPFICCKKHVLTSQWIRCFTYFSVQYRAYLLQHHKITAGTAREGRHFADRRVVITLYLCVLAWGFPDYVAFYLVSSRDRITQMHLHLRWFVINWYIWHWVRGIIRLTSYIFKITSLDCMKRVKHPFISGPEQHRFAASTRFRELFWHCCIEHHVVVLLKICARKFATLTVPSDKCWQSVLKYAVIDCLRIFPNSSFTIILPFRTTER